MTKPAAPAPAPVQPEDEAARRLTQLEKLTTIAGDPYRITRFDKSIGAADLKKQFEGLANGEKTDKKVRVAGRIMSIRNDGMFIDILDDSDRLQVFHHIK